MRLWGRCFLYWSWFRAGWSETHVSFLSMYRTATVYTKAQMLLTQHLLSESFLLDYCMIMAWTSLSALLTTRNTADLHQITAILSIFAVTRPSFILTLCDRTSCGPISRLLWFILTDMIAAALRSIMLKSTCVSISIHVLFQIATVEVGDRPCWGCDLPPTCIHPRC